jgi:hypothetical protein
MAKHTAMDRAAVIRWRVQVQKAITATIVGSIKFSPIGLETSYLVIPLRMLLFLP